jgi:hypothetical protein
MISGGIRSTSLRAQQAVNRTTLVNDAVSNSQNLHSLYRKYNGGSLNDSKGNFRIVNLNSLDIDTKHECKNQALKREKRAYECDKTEERLDVCG